MYGFPFWSLPNGLCQARPPISSRYSKIAKSCTEALVSACCGLLTLGSRGKYAATHGSSNPSNAASPILGKLYPRSCYSTQFSQNRDFGLSTCSLLVSSLVWHAKGRLNKAACYCAHDRNMRQMHCEALGYLVIGIDTIATRWSIAVINTQDMQQAKDTAIDRAMQPLREERRTLHNRVSPRAIGPVRRKKKKGRELKSSLFQR